MDELPLDRLRPWVFFLLAAAALSLAGCNLPGLRSADPGHPATTRAGTAAAVLTQSGPNIRATGQALQTPSALGTTPAGTSPVAATTEPAEEEPCDHSAAFVDDVTVRDNTKFEPNQSFVKVWRLRNVSNCTWTPGYLLTFFGGNRMGASSTVPLSQEVPPSTSVDLAVDMQAPAAVGTYQGFWKLRSPDGEYFGIGPQGDQSFWVKIQVAAPPTSALSPTTTPSPTATASPPGTELPTSTPTESAEATTSATPSDTPLPTATSTPTFSPTPTIDGD